MRPLQGLAGAALVATGATVTSPSWACAVCATSDVTLTPADNERAFRSRVQAIADARAGSVEEGGITVGDRRLELAGTYAPSEDMLFTLGVPALTRYVTSETGAVERTSLGDVETRMQVVHAKTLAGGVRERFGVLIALKLPTAPLQNDASGVVLAPELQPGCGSLAPAGGLDYAIGKGAWSGYGSVSLWLPFPVRAGPHAGDSLRTGARAQWQPVRQLALRAGPSFQLDTSGELPSGAGDPNSGGALGYAAVEVVASPATDFVVALGALYPALQALRGDHRVGPIATASLVYDF